MDIGGFLVLILFVGFWRGCGVFLVCFLFCFVFCLLICSFFVCLGIFCFVLVFCLGFFVLLCFFVYLFLFVFVFVCLLVDGFFTCTPRDVRPGKDVVPWIFLHSESEFKQVLCSVV